MARLRVAKHDGGGAACQDQRGNQDQSAHRMNFCGKDLSVRTGAAIALSRGGHACEIIPEPLALRSVRVVKVGQIRISITDRLAACGAGPRTGLAPESTPTPEL